MQGGGWAEGKEDLIHQGSKGPNCMEPEKTTNPRRKGWKGEMQREPKIHKSAINSPLWATGKGTTIKHQQINPCASWRASSDFTNFEKSLSWPMSQQSSSNMHVPLFPLYGFGLIQIKPNRKLKALGFFSWQGLRKTTQVTWKKNPSWRIAVELLRKIMHS